MWNGVTDGPLPPDEMLDWLDARADLLDQIAKRDGAARSATSLQHEIAEAKRQLVGLLQDTAIAASAGSLPLNGILATAEVRIRTEEANAQKRTELALDERKLKADVERKRGVVEGAEKERAAWNAQWKDALAALSLSAEGPIETIQEQIDAIDQMRETSVKIADLQHEQIGKIERDIKAFATEVERLVASVSVQLAGEDADEAALKLHARLNASKQARDSLNEKSEAVENLQKKLDDCDRSRNDARVIMTGLQRAAGAGTIDALREAIQRSDQQRALKDERARLRDARSRW